MAGNNQYSEINRIINAYCSDPNKKGDLFFIQIGAHDGITGDPIHEYIKKYGWKGILVEPVTYLFRSLLQTYKGYKDLSFENVAISDKSGDKTFYRIEENSEIGMPNWYDQLGSFKQEVVEKHKNAIPNFSKHFISEKVKCMTLIDLISKHNVSKIDYLQIDTEGYDFEVIKLIPFDSIKPIMMLYEHKHLSPTDKQDCESLLLKQGYKIIPTNSCAFAYIPQD